MSFIEIESRHYERGKLYAAFVIGWGFGLWSIPANALDSQFVSESVRTGELQVSMYPATTAFLAAIVAIPIAYYLFVQYSKSQIDRRYSEGENNGL